MVWPIAIPLAEEALAGLAALATCIWINRDEIAEGVVTVGEDVIDVAKDVTASIVTEATAQAWQSARTTAHLFALTTPLIEAIAPLPVTKLIEAARPFPPGIALPRAEEEEAPPSVPDAHEESSTPANPPPPEPPWKRAIDRVLAQMGRGIATFLQHPATQAIGNTIKWVTYANGAVGLTKSAICRIAECEDTDPVLYDLAQLFGVESDDARTAFGIYQMISAGPVIARGLSLGFGPILSRGFGVSIEAGTANGAAATAASGTRHIVSFTTAMINESLGVLATISPQLESMGIDPSAIDWNRATLSQASYSAVGYLALGYNLALRNRFPWTPRATWIAEGLASNDPIYRWMAQGIAAFERVVPARAANAVLLPEFPTWQHTLAFGAGWMAGGAALQPLVSLIDGSDTSETAELGWTRRGLVFWLEPYLGMGISQGRTLLQLLDYGLFVSMMRQMTPYYSAYDGEPPAVNRALQKLQAAKTAPEIMVAVGNPPFTNKDFWGEADRSLATETWTAITVKAANNEHFPGKGDVCTIYETDNGRTDRLHPMLESARALLRSDRLSDRHVGFALVTLMEQVGLTPRCLDMGPDRWACDSSRTILQRALTALPRRLTERRLTEDELEEVFEDIDNGVYDD